MKKLMFMFLTMIALSPLAHAQASWNPGDVTLQNDGEPNGKHSRDWGYKMGAIKCVFDPSAVTGDRTIAAHACSGVIPKNSYVTKAYYKVITTFTSATDAGTIAVSITGANDIVSAVSIATGTTWDASGIIIAIPTGSMANEVAVTADSSPTFTVAVEALTAGKLVMWFEYVYYGDI